MTPETQNDTWREVARRYYIHHMHCHICVAAGLGTRYGVRCIAGEALWREYADCAGTWAARNARRELQP